MEQPRTATRRPLSAGFAQAGKDCSMLYSILPAAVQSRLPRLPSIRRSASMYGLPSHRDLSTISTPGSGSRTPEYEYKTAIVLVDQEERSNGFVIESASVSSEEDDNFVSRLDAKLGKRTERLEAYEVKSGIEWKFANQGTTTLKI